MFREKLGKKRIPFNDEQRRSLAVKGEIFGRKMLAPLNTRVLMIRRKPWDRARLPRVSGFPPLFGFEKQEECRA